MPPRLSLPSPRAPAVTLAATLMVAALLAWEAHHAARSHRETAERALRDYATVAAWELLAGATDPLQQTLGDALGVVSGSRATTPYEVLPQPTALVPSASAVLPCPDAEDDSARTYFRLDLRDASLTTTGAMLSEPARRQMTKLLTEHASASYRPDWRYAAIVAPPGMPGRALVYGVRYAAHGAPIALFGFTTCAGAFGAPLFGAVTERHPLLPRALTGAAPNESLLTLAVFTRAGDTLYRSAARGPSPFTADATQESIGGLTARAALRPRAIQQLALGALPTSRLPLLLALFALTTILAVVAVLQFRRDQALARLRSDFVSSVSHELRTPLSQILLFAETLRLGRVRTEEERRDAAEIIVLEARRLSQLVENVLHCSRAERHMASLAPEPIVIAPFVAEVLELWQPASGGSGVNVRVDADQRAVACVDRGALRQVLLNLLDNAVKYGPPSQTLSITLTQVGEQLRLELDDEGPGIPEAQRERIWQPFYRLPRDVAAATAGSGIGLFVVRELVALHGGRATVDAAPGGGARFRIELPAGIPEPVSGFGVPAALATAPSVGEAWRQ